MRLRATGVMLLVGLMSVAALAQDREKEASEKTSAADRPILAEEKFSTTEHRARVGGAEIPYTATAGELVLRGEKGKARANMFFVAYTKSDVTDERSRPITFAYNRGPGSATVWLHMGLLGPKRVQMAVEGFQPAPPYRLVDNESTILDVTDFVAIDDATPFAETERTFDKKDVAAFYAATLSPLAGTRANPTEPQ